MAAIAAGAMAKGAMAKGGTVKASSLMSGGAGGEEISLLGKINKGIGSLEKTTKKIMKNLEKSSPAFKQMITVFEKGINLFWRPVGDIIAKFVRPMAIWFLKIATRLCWNWVVVRGSIRSDWQTYFPIKTSSG